MKAGPGQVAVIGEARERRPSLRTLEALTLARALAGPDGPEPKVILIPEESCFSGSLPVDRLGKYWANTQIDYAVLPDSTPGRDLAPALAVDLGGSCITGVEAVKNMGDSPVFVRRINGGSQQALVQPVSEPVVLTVRSGMFEPAEGLSSEQVTVLTGDREPEAEPVRLMERREPDWSAGPVPEAEVVIAGGRGLGSADNLRLLEDLARLLPNSAIAGSRPVCDLGWLSYDRQVGLSGAVIEPRLYLACGISGAPQHLAGMDRAEFIVALNSDPRAAINAIADVIITADLEEFIPALIRAIAEIGTQA